MPTSSDASMYTIIFTSIFLFYNIHLFTTIKKFSDPSRDLTTSETLTAMRLHFGGDSKYSWHQINKNRSTNRITSQLAKEETTQTVEKPKEPVNVEFLGQKIDPIEKSIGESRGEENSPRFMNGNKPVRYHKHHLSNQEGFSRIFLADILESRGFSSDFSDNSGYPCTNQLLLNLIHAIIAPTYWPYDILETIKAGSLYDRLPNWSNKE